MYKIALEGMEFFAFHGVYPEEQVIGGKFTADVEISFQPEQEIAEHLDRTIDYEAIYRIVKAEMDKPCKLIETVAERIIEQLVHAFPKTAALTVRIRKHQPPLQGFTDRASVEITRKLNT